MATTRDAPAVGTARNLRMRDLILLDLFLVCLAVLFAILLRLEKLPASLQYLQGGGWTLLLLSPAIRLPLYFHFNLYHRLWRYASMDDLLGILNAGLAAPLIIALVNFGLFPAIGLPYSHSGSVWLLEAIVSLGMLGALRFSLRFLYQTWANDTISTQTAAPVATLIVGAGDAGAMILREIKRNPSLDIHVIGLVDDDIRKHDKTLLGVPVLGGCDTLPALLTTHNIRNVIIAMPTAPGIVIRSVVQSCEASNIRPTIVPRLDDLVNNRLLLNHLRPVEIDDLLRREPIVTDAAAVRQLLHGKRVLVTGGGGSIGSELCRQILRCEPAELIIVGHGENSVFEINQKLRQIQQRRHLTTKLTTYIADIQMRDRLLRLFQQTEPQIVFHAAAHKHVPLMEANPSEAVNNNILGTRNVLFAAQAVNVERFVMVSTDKAVNPTSVMGATKRAAELLVLDAARRLHKPYVAVRFGNVLGSRGSVIHTFKQQIAQGGPVTVTDPAVSRFFMTIPEASQLLLQAAALGTGGEIFMLDMGKSIRIVDLATDLIQLSGLEVGRDIEIVYSGLRPGEKLTEELFLPGEVYHTTAHPKIRIAGNAGESVPAQIYTILEKLENAISDENPARLLEQLQILVPEYQRRATTPLTPASARKQEPDIAAPKLTYLPLGNESFD